MKEYIEIGEILDFFTKGTTPKDYQQERITAALMGLQNTAKAREVDLLNLKDWYFDIAAQDLKINGIEGSHLRKLLDLCILEKMSKMHENAETPEVVTLTSRYVSWEQRRDALRHGLPDYFRVGAEVAGHGVEEIIHPIKK